MTTPRSRWTILTEAIASAAGRDKTFAQLFKLEAEAAALGWVTHLNGIAPSCDPVPKERRRRLIGG